MNSLTIGASAIARNRGWPVFPVNADKAPACRHGCRDATKDDLQITNLFSRASEAVFVAIATGPGSGVAALDIDPAALTWFETRRKMFRPTWTQRTPRGGWHLLYEWPPGLRNSAGKLHRGVDIRGDGGSCIVHGPGYEVTDGRDPASFPAWILSALAKIDAARAAKNALVPPTQTGDISALTRFVLQSTRGERNSRLHWAACRAGSQAAALLPAAIECGLDAREARSTILSAMRKVR